MRRVLVVLTAAAAAYCQEAQPGSVEGQVTTASGEPIRKVSLRLQKDQHSVPGEADESGYFLFERLDPGNYMLSADRSGYLSAWANVRVSPGERTTGVAIKLMAQAIIAGKVMDEDGDPYPGARVTVGKWNYASGHQQFIASGSIAAAADGTFVIGNLSGGRYFVTANSSSASGGGEQAYTTTFYPGVTDPAAAVPVELSAGKELRGIELRMRKSRVFRVSGKIVDSTGGPPPNTIVNLYVEGISDLGPLGLPSQQVRNGVFEFNRVPPGNYILQVNPLTIRAPDGSNRTVPLTGRERISLGNGNLDNVELRVGPGAEISGRIALEGNLPPGPRLRVQLTPTEGVTPGAGNGQVNDDRSFVLHNLAPVKYRVTIVPMPPGTYVKSVRFGGVDITHSVLDLTAGTGGALEVTLSPNAAQVRGSLRSAGGNIQVTLWSTDGSEVRTSVTGGDGGVTFAGLAPGEYRIAAWEQLELGMANVPEFRNAFNNKAATVRLSENSRESVEVPLVGRVAIEAEAAKIQ